MDPALTRRINAAFTACDQAAVIRELASQIEGHTARLDDLAIRDGDNRARLNGYAPTPAPAPAPEAPRETDVVRRADVLAVLSGKAAAFDGLNYVASSGLREAYGAVTALAAYDAAPPAPDAAAIRDAALEEAACAAWSTGMKLHDGVHRDTRDTGSQIADAIRALRTSPAPESVGEREMQVALADAIVNHGPHATAPIVRYLFARFAGRTITRKED